MSSEPAGNAASSATGTPEAEEANKLNDPGNEDPGSLMDDATVPLDEVSPDDPDIAGEDGSRQPE